MMALLLTKAYNPYEIGSLETIIFAFFIGACLAGFAAVYHRRTIGSLVHYLLAEEAFSKESAKTLRDAEQDLNLFLRLTLKRNVAFKRIVCMVEETADEKKKKDISFSDIPLYINPKERDRAEKMYSKYTASDATVINVILSIALLAIIAYISYLVVPELITMAAGMFKFTS